MLGAANPDQISALRRKIAVHHAKAKVLRKDKQFAQAKRHLAAAQKLEADLARLLRHPGKGRRGPARPGVPAAPRDRRLRGFIRADGSKVGGRVLTPRTAPSEASASGDRSLTPEQKRRIDHLKDLVERIDRLVAKYRNNPVKRAYWLLKAKAARARLAYLVRFQARAGRRIGKLATRAARIAAARGAQGMRSQFPTAPAIPAKTIRTLTFERDRAITDLQRRRAGLPAAQVDLYSRRVMDDGTTGEEWDRMPLAPDVPLPGSQRVVTSSEFVQPRPGEDMIPFSPSEPKEDTSSEDTVDLEAEEPGFFARWWWALLLGGVAAGAVAVGASKKKGKKASAAGRSPGSASKQDRLEQRADLVGA